ncbi:MAG: hypothetical protein AAFW95_05190 [Cyanobacteria bacterium J06638_6]
MSAPYTKWHTLSRVDRITREVYRMLGDRPLPVNFCPIVIDGLYVWRYLWWVGWGVFNQDWRLGARST